ncbi:MAG: family containing protein [Bryobacterales bacterium]|nr:family containing protein [Bryobacterales bacterium]
MNRRKAIRGIAAGSGLGPLLAADSPQPEYYELRSYQLRNGYSKTTLPVKLAGAGAVGVFNPVIGENTPSVLVLMTHRTFADAERAPDLDFDYVRYERTILRAFPGRPRMQVPPEAKSPRIFELRTYESNNAATLRRKIEMFDKGEAAIFQRLGMRPVFFGEAIAGASLPHLSYMLCYDDLAARDRLWKAFGADPEWQKLRSQPGLSDAEIVSNISNVILRAAPSSDIR